MSSVLVVEDEIKLARLLKDYLQKEGYSAHVLGNGGEVVSWIQENSPRCVLLDVMLPGIDGLSLCKRIRAFSKVPIIFITARIEEIDKLLGLEFGADDYICKPFSPREVIARVKALLRRVEMEQLPNKSASRLNVDREKHIAVLDDTLLNLTPVEFRLLENFYHNPNKIFSRQMLIDRAYKDYRVISNRTVDSHIKNLRKKLKRVDPQKEFIEAVYGVGYRFNFLE